MAVKPKTIVERDALTFEKTMKSFQPKRVEPKREAKGVPMGV